jgi:hypothetical protein
MARLAVRGLILPYVALFSLAAGAADSARGEVLYGTYCASCHGADPLLGSPALAANDPARILSATQTIPQMAFLQPILTPADREDIAAYIGVKGGYPPYPDPYPDPDPDPTVPVVPETGWYWNPSEGGRGFFVEQRADSVFMAGFHYEMDGSATWFVGQGMAINSYLTSPMFMFRGGQTLTGAWDAAEQGTSPGPMTIYFDTPSAATLDWPGGTVSLVRFPSAPGGVTAPQAGAPQSGWWWNANEGGRGFAIEFQGEYVFIAGFMYASDGDPTWYATNGRMTAPNVYENEWYAFTGGQAMGQPWHAAVATTPNAGTVRLEFSDATHGTLTLPDGRQVALVRFEF